MKLLGYANAFRIKQTCADKPGGAHLGQVAIYAGESVDPMVIQERENPTHMGDPVVASLLDVLRAAEQYADAAEAGGYRSLIARLQPYDVRLIERALRHHNRSVRR